MLKTFRKRQNRRRHPKGPLFAIVPKDQTGAKRRQMLAHPEKLPLPPLTRKLKEAYTHHGRQAAYKFLTRNPRLKKKFVYVQVGK